MAINGNKWQSPGNKWEGVTFSKGKRYGVEIDSIIETTTNGATNSLIDAKKNGYKSEFWNTNDSHWDGGLGIDKTLAMGVDGWKNQGKIIERMAEKAGEYAQEMPRQEMYWDVTGAAWDMGAVMAGLPECGLNFRETNQDTLVRVMVNCYYSGGVSNDTLEKRARAIAALATSLHNGGYDIEVLLIMPCRLRGKKYLIEVQVQDPTRIYDLDRLAFWMGHPAAVRNLIYGVDGLVNGEGMGMSNLSQDILTGIKARAVQEGWLYVEEAYLSGYSGGSGRCEDMCQTEEGSVAWIKKQMEFVKEMKMAAAEGREPTVGLACDESDLY